MLKEKSYYENIYELYIYSKDKQIIWENYRHDTLKTALENLAENIEDNKNEQYYFEIRFVRNYVFYYEETDKETEILENKLIVSGYTNN